MLFRFLTYFANYNSQIDVLINQLECKISFDLTLFLIKNYLLCTHKLVFMTFHNIMVKFTHLNKAARIFTIERNSRDISFLSLTVEHLQILILELMWEENMHLHVV